jgi:uncharacterized iron-regulated membrane protein
MAQSTVSRLRGIWLQVHKWIGLLLALLIIPISLSGSALVWHDGLEEMLRPGRFAVSGGEPALPPSAYAAAARQVLEPGELVASITYSKGEGPVLVAAAQPPSPGATRAARTNVWLDPADARVLDKAGSNDGAVRFLHGLHGSLTVPGVGRQIVGWVGVAMSLSCLTGLWLWWPIAAASGAAFAGSGRIRPAPTSIIRWASGSCCRWRCYASPAPGSHSLRSSAASRRPSPGPAAVRRTAPGRCGQGRSNGPR